MGTDAGKVEPADAAPGLFCQNGDCRQELEPEAQTEQGMQFGCEKCHTKWHFAFGKLIMVRGADPTTPAETADN